MAWIGGDVDVAATGGEPVGPDEPEAFVTEVEEPGDGGGVAGDGRFGGGHPLSGDDVAIHPLPVSAPAPATAAALGVAGPVDARRTTGAGPLTATPPVATRPVAGGHPTTAATRHLAATRALTTAALGFTGADTRPVAAGVPTLLPDPPRHRCARTGPASPATARRS